MPIYEYICQACGHGFEHLARSTRDAAPNCPACGKPSPSKQLSSFAPAVVAPGARACNACSENTACPSAGRGCGGFCPTM